MATPWAVLARIGLVLVVAVSVLVVSRLDDHRWDERLRVRFVAGVPWGTVLTVGFVLAVYLFVQGGFAHWRHPVSIPFRAWSYCYPLGMIAAPFSHVGSAHLTGNLLGTLVLAPLAEFAWGHYPTTRTDAASGSLPTSSSSSRLASLAATPIARVLAVPGAAIGVGLLTSLFSIGPVIGFSGVVFAFAGFSLVRYPLATVVAYSASGVLRQVYTALRTPVVHASAGSGGFGPPWWATVAIQDHALGLLVGVVLGIRVFRRRETMPSAGRLWLGTLVFAVGQSLWAVYWFRGNGRFVLYRALGVVLVFALALLVAASVTVRGRFRPTRRWVGGIERRSVAAVVIVLALLMLAAPAIPANLTTSVAGDRAIAPAGGATGPAERLSVRDYTVYYAENVTNREVSVVDLSAFNQSTTVDASGVIVESPRRNLWTAAVRKSRLAFAGCATVGLGGVGWRGRVHVVRTGWNVVGGGHAYTIRLGRGPHPRRVVYRSDPATAGPTIEGRNVSMVARKVGFGLAVTRANETLDRVALPKNGTSVRAGTLTFTRNGGELFVSADGTRVEVATHESYH